MHVHRLDRLGTGLLVLLVCVSTAAPAADDALSAHLLRQLSCIDPPSPLASLIALENQGRFDVSEGERRDSATCWALKPALDLADMTFDHVCASTEDPLLISQFPAFFWRSPGTSPGETLVFTTTQTAPTVAAWADANLGNDAKGVGIAAGGWIDGETDVGCSRTLVWP